MCSDVEGTSASRLNPQTPEQYAAIFDALSHPVRIKVLGTLCRGKQHISELARTINISRPLLYMHLKKLEAAGLITGYLGVSEAGQAIKYCVAVDFDVRLLPSLMVELADMVVVPSSE